jgi:putative toxin-antitoxin system antitoxin component (TIGR02293 family)
MVRSEWATIGVTTDERIDAVKRGLAIQHLHQFLESTQLPREAVLKVLKLTNQDFENNQQLSPEESERLWRLAAVYERSFALFEGDSERTLQWLSTPQRAIGQDSPLEHVVTEPGAAEVRDLIGRIEHGVFS